MWVVEPLSSLFSLFFSLFPFFCQAGQACFSCTYMDMRGKALPQEGRRGAEIHLSFYSLVKGEWASFLWPIMT